MFGGSTQSILEYIHMRKQPLHHPCIYIYTVTPRRRRRYTDFLKSLPYLSFEHFCYFVSTTSPRQIFFFFSIFEPPPAIPSKKKIACNAYVYNKLINSFHSFHNFPFLPKHVFSYTYHIKPTPASYPSPPPSLFFPAYPPPPCLC